MDWTVEAVEFVTQPLLLRSWFDGTQIEEGALPSSSHRLQPYVAREPGQAVQQETFRAGGAGRNPIPRTGRAEWKAEGSLCSCE
jgi:hypothetical protein